MNYGIIANNTADSGYIALNDSSNVSITGNSGLDIVLGNIKYSSITGNSVSNRDSGIVLQTSSSYNAINGNVLYNMIRAIRLTDTCNANIISNNHCIRGTGISSDYTASNHTIVLEGTGNNNNLIIGNMCLGKAITNEGGTGNTLVDNKS